MVLDKLWIGAVSYLNTKPLIRAFEQGALKDQIHLVLDHPANLAKRLEKGELDAALLPIGAMRSGMHIFSPFCIASNGNVASVCLFSQVPINEVEEVYLDYQSRTSAALTQILFKFHWKPNPTFIATQEGFIDRIQGKRAGLIIGDRALEQREHFPYVYDLAKAWYEFKGLPFVFAAWLTSKNLGTEFVDAFNLAIKGSLEEMDTIISETKYDAYDLNVYYKKNISYWLNESCHAAIEEFRAYIAAL